MDLERINRNCTKVTRQRNCVVSLDREDYDALNEIASELSMHISSLARGLLLTFKEDYLSDQKDAE